MQSYENMNIRHQQTKAQHTNKQITIEKIKRFNIK